MNDKLQQFKNGEIVLNTPTKALYDKLMQWCEKEGLIWHSGDNATQQPESWDCCKENLCIRVWCGCLYRSDISYYKERGYTVVTLTERDFEFTKDDLKTGMVVETRNGRRYLVLRGELPTSIYGIQGLMLINDTGLMDNKYSNNLKYINANYDIVKVYQANICGIKYIFDDENLTSLWERDDKADEINKTIDTLTKQLEEAKKKLGDFA